jgi:hypothetical protein
MPSGHPKLNFKANDSLKKKEVNAKDEIKVKEEGK